MKRECQFVSAATVVEMMVSVAILALAMSAAISGWLYVFRGEKMNSVQNELDMDVRSAMERLRADLRLSSLDKIFYYPDGPGPYSAISLPLARDDNGDGLVERDNDGKIIWDSTVIYHVWAGTPNELRKTTFDPRDTNLPPSSMQAQIDSVVAVGNGSATYGSTTAHTVPIFKNLFNWEIYGNGAKYDSYREQLTRDDNVVFGSALLSPGAHTLTFKVVGQNAASTGFRIGIDSLVVSPCGVPREAEEQYVSASSGVAPVPEYMGGSWDGGFHMGFPATATGQYFSLSMENDRWEETNFRGNGSINDDTRVDFEETFTPQTFVVRCVPPTTNWYASNQTLDLEPDDAGSNELKGAAVRVLLRGADMLEGNGIKNSGLFHCLWLLPASNENLHIKGAYIAECASESNYTPDAASTGIQLLWHGSSSDAEHTIQKTDSAPYWTLASGNLEILREKSYMVSFLVADNSGECGTTRWLQNPINPSNPTPPGCYVIPGSGAPDLTMTRATTWSANTNVIVSPYLFTLEHVHCLAASNGTWTSQIVDTHLTAPTYTTLTWSNYIPSGKTWPVTPPLKMRLRTGSDENMSDASEWTNAPVVLTAGGVINPPGKRYVQVQAEMWSDTTRNYVPSLKDFIVKWDGERRVADIGGTITQSKSNGVFEVLLDGSNIIKRGITVDLTIFKYVRGFSPGPTGSNILTSTISAEIEPRNTGK